MLGRSSLIQVIKTNTRPVRFPLPTCTRHALFATAAPLPKAASTRKKRTLKKAISLPPLPPLPVAGSESDGADLQAGADAIIAAEPSSALIDEVRQIQDLHPEHILLVQVGSFFEIYDHTGYLNEIATLLHLKIASQKNTKKNSVRYTGFPVSKVKNYLEILIKSGKTVALVEQVGKDLEHKGKNFTRDVTRIFTPGTVLDEDWVENRENNFLLCITPSYTPSNSTDLGLAWLDVSVGDFLVCDTSVDAFEQHYARIQPKEVLCDETLKETHPALIKFLQMRSDSFHLSFKSPEPEAEKLLGGVIIQHDHSKALFADRRTLLARFSPLQVQAAGTLIGYVTGNFRSTQPPYTVPSTFLPEEVMSIDPVTQQALEITRTFRERSRKGSLLQEIDDTKTAAGSRLLASRLKAPSVCAEEINRRLNLVMIFHEDTHLLSDIRELLANTKDVERALQKIHIGRASPGDYINIVSTLRVSSEIILHLQKKSSQIAAQTGISTSMDALDDLLARLVGSQKLLAACDEIFEETMQDLQSITEMDAIKEKVSPVLDERRQVYRSLIKKQELLQSKLQKQYDLGDKECITTFDFRLGPICATSRLDAVQRRHSKLLIQRDPRAELFDRANAVILKFSHTEWTALARTIEDCKKDLLDLQAAVFEDACNTVKEHTLAFIQTCKALAETDVAASSAAYARERGCVRPEITDELVHDVKGGRHPVVERAQTHRESMFIQNDYRIGGEQRLWLLTGPNMGGKSTFLRQSALISILAQTGLYVPATSARLGIVDRIFSRVGASDDLAAHQSTFMVEMQETATILKNATERSFVIMDEVGRGTSTRDGLALAYATLAYLHEHCKCRAVFATHYHELASRVSDSMREKKGMFKSVTCYRTAVLDDQDGNIIYTYRLETGIMTRSHGIECARTAGLPKEVIDLATDYYEELESEHDLKARLWQEWRKKSTKVPRLRVARVARPDGAADLRQAMA